MCVCVCAYVWLPSTVCMWLWVFLSVCVCVRALTPERLSSLSSEATGVQSVCFHTPLLRYNGSHFFSPPFLFYRLCASSSLSSFCSLFYHIRSWNLSLPPPYSLLPPHFFLHRPHLNLLYWSVLSLFQLHSVAQLGSAGLSLTWLAHF